MADFPPGTVRRIEADARSLAFAVAVTEAGQVHILDDLCTHANARLSEGWLEEDCLACPWHGAQFELATGRALSLPATGQVATHPAIVKEGVLYTEIEATDLTEGLDESHLDG
jgi:nitrite reductase/ring-hydroxylating ferredoxin subunit